MAVSFILQDPPAMQNVIYSAPSIDMGRPQGEDHEKITRNRDAAADAALVGRK